MNKDGLLRRARLVARLQHPNLARMLPMPGGAGLTPVANGARRLADFEAPNGAFNLELEPRIWLLLDVLSGLRALHELVIDGAGFVHGAVSPQYILLGEPGSARLVPVTSAHLNAGSARATSGYAAPEALLGDATDLRADLFSVGVLLWEGLAQRRLFPDGSCGAVMARLDRVQAPALCDLVTASWALPLCRVAERALAVAPDDRFSSALEFSSAIVAAAGPRLTAPEPAARTRRVDAPRPEAAPRASRWRSATPLSLVLDLPPRLLNADVSLADVSLDDVSFDSVGLADVSFDSVSLDSERAAPPLVTEQPAFSPHWQRWQPVLAALGAVMLALSAWRLVHPPALAAAQQPPAAVLLPPATTQLRTPPPTTPAATPAAVTPSPDSAPGAVQPKPRPAPRKSRPRPRLDEHAGRDYGI